MKFTAKKVNKKKICLTKSRKVILNYNKKLQIFTVKGKDGNIYKVLNSTPTGAKTNVFSTPDNIKHKNWTPYKITKPIKKENLYLISKYWSRFYDNQKVSINKLKLELYEGERNTI